MTVNIRNLNVGDKLQVIDASGREDYLQNGQVFEFDAERQLRENRDDLLYVKGRHDCFFPQRFVKYIEETGRAARPIDYQSYTMRCEPLKKSAILTVELTNPEDIQRIINFLNTGVTQ